MATPLWSDNPTELDLLGFADVTAPIVEAVLRDNLDPVTVGIEGDWGSGKTSMLKLLASELREDGSVVVIETHPWEYDPATDPKATLIADVLAALHAEAGRRGDLSEDVVAKFKALAKRVRVTKVIKLAANSLLSMGLPDIDSILGLFDEKTEVVSDPGLQGFRSEFANLMDGFADIRRVVVLVDDLDRCLPETVIATLEAMKLFLSVPKMAFVLAADRRAVAHAVATKYEPSPLAGELGRQYLEKLVHIPVRVPALGQAESTAYLAMLMLEPHLSEDEIRTSIDYCNARRAAGEGDVLEGLPQVGFSDAAKSDLHLARMLAPVLFERLNGNPRRLKRFLNSYWLRATVASRRGIELQPNALAKLMVLEELDDSAFNALLGWLREGVLIERLRSLEEGKPAAGAAGVAGAALEEWARRDPLLSGVAALDSYLRLAASLRSQVGAEAGLRSDVKQLVESFLDTRASVRKKAITDLPTQPQDTRLHAAKYLLDHVVTNPDRQNHIGPALAALAADADLLPIIATGLKEIAPARVDASLVVALLPEKDAHPQLREVVADWNASGHLQKGAASMASKRLATKPAGSA